MSFDRLERPANRLHILTLPLARQHDMEVLGTHAPSTAFVIFALGSVQILKSSYEHLWRDAHDFGILPAIVLRLGLFEAKGVVEQVREHFIRDDGGLEQAMAFKDS